MAKENLIIGDIFQLPDGDMCIGLNTEKPALRDEWRQTPINELKDLVRGKVVRVKGANNDFTLEVRDVEVTASIADFKNIFLKVESNALSDKITMSDRLEIEL